MAKFKPEDLPTGQESRESHAEFIKINWPVAATLSKDPPQGESHLFGASQVVYVPYQRSGCEMLGQSVCPS